MKDPVVKNNSSTPCGGGPDLAARIGRPIEKRVTSITEIDMSIREAMRDGPHDPSRCSRSWRTVACTGTRAMFRASRPSARSRASPRGLSARSTGSSRAACVPPLLPSSRRWQWMAPAFPTMTASLSRSNRPRERGRSRTSNATSSGRNLPVTPKIAVAVTVRGIDFSDPVPAVSTQSEGG